MLQLGRSSNQATVPSWLRSLPSGGELIDERDAEARVAGLHHIVVRSREPSSHTATLRYSQREVTMVPSVPGKDT